MGLVGLSDLEHNELYNSDSFSRRASNTAFLSKL